MDNDAFKDLVRSKVKSTKEIAREAVEEAFLLRKKKRKRKGRRADDDDLSSSDSDSEGNRRNKNAKQQERDNNQFLKPTAVKRKGKDKRQCAQRRLLKCKECGQAEIRAE